MTLSQANPDQLQPTPKGSGRIVRVGSSERTRAIERLVGTGSGRDRAAAERFMNYARSNEVRLDGLWARLAADGRPAFSVLAVPSPGRTAMIFASHPRRDPEVTEVGGLIDHACGEIAGWDLDLAQALLEPSEKLEREAFLVAGFSELARLSYLERALSRSSPPPPPRWPAGTRLEPYTDDLQDVLHSVLEESYRDTLDCPGLYGLRRTEDIVAGHRATGAFDTDLWTLLWVDEHPAGVLLLNPFPGHKTVELVYLGLAPFARRRGLGRQLVRHGLCQLRKRPERSLTLAVDQRNTPALRLYQSEGFRAVVDRVALIRSLRVSEALR